MSTPIAKFASRFAAILLSAALLQPAAVNAFETDQYNLPKVPLADIGDEVTEYVAANLEKAIERVNAEIARSSACLSKPAKGCTSPEKERARLDELRTGDAIAKELFDRLGGGELMFTKMGRWMSSHKFRSQPAFYTSPYGESIYTVLPTNYFTISPTVRLFGCEFGQDKLEHIFQQGYQYYKIRRDAAASGVPEAVALSKAVDWGKKTEQTYYGLWVSGVYSNGDLAANIAGLRFYDSLTRPVSVGDRNIRPAVVLQNGVWHLRSRVGLIKPFISDHFNEALNPSIYSFLIFRSVQKAVKKYGCPEWRTSFADMTADGFRTRSNALQTWFGDDYGYKSGDRMVKLGNTCFE